MGDTPVQCERSTINGPTKIWETGLSLIHPFFGEDKRFELQFQGWREFSDEQKDAIEIIVVDDHGDPAIHELMTKNRVKYCDFNLSIYRIEDDLRWNTPGALNLGLMAASRPWTLIMDSDCAFPSETMNRVLNLQPYENWVYKFPRNRITEDEKWATNKRYLPCTMLQHKHIFTDVHGFDEDFTGQWSGGYGFFDNHYDFKVRHAGYHIGQIPDIIADEWMDDIVGDRVQRDHGKHHAINKKIMYEKMNAATTNHKMLRFSWKRVFHHRRHNALRTR